MRVLMASTPATGHINPLLPIGRMLSVEGHDVLVLSGSWLRDRIEAAGLRFRPFPVGADLDLRDVAAAFPELTQMPIGMERMRLTLERVFIDCIAPQHEGLQEALQDFPADVVVGDNTLFGVLPMLLGPASKRPPVVLCGTSFLHWRREDGAPHFLGLPPADTPSQRAEYAAVAQEYDRVVERPVGRLLNAVLKDLGVGPLTMKLWESVVALADSYLQLSVPGFEFVRRFPASVSFVGALPIVPNQAPIPSWANDLDGSRKVVLVTQGTVANHDFGLLIGPALTALADEPDVLVVVTTGGRPVDAVPGSIPANARVASYLPFEWLLPKVDVLVTNGGYGTVNQALSFGIPLVTAGLSEDKADVNARVAWSGVGIDLATNQAEAGPLGRAVRAVLDEPHYRARAAQIAAEHRAIDTRSEVLRIITQASRPAKRRAPRQQQAA